MDPRFPPRASVTDSITFRSHNHVRYRSPESRETGHARYSPSGLEWKSNQYERYSPAPLSKCCPHPRNLPSGNGPADQQTRPPISYENRIRWCRLLDCHQYSGRQHRTATVRGRSSGSNHCRHGQRGAVGSNRHDATEAVKRKALSGGDRRSVFG